MRSSTLVLSAFLLISSVGQADAAKKKKRPVAVETKKGSDEKTPPPGDKGTNEGAQGRKNATEDAAKAAEGGWNERRP